MTTLQFQTRKVGGEPSSTDPDKPILVYYDVFMRFMFVPQHHCFGGFFSTLIVILILILIQRGFISIKHFELQLFEKCYINKV